MKPLSQLWLIVKKNFIIKIRQPILLCLELCWPIFVFAVVVIIRLSTLPDPPRECHKAPRALPSAGTLPFLQSFICNLDNACLNRTEAALKPGGRGKRGGTTLLTLAEDGRVKRVLRDLPHSIMLVNYIREILKTADDEGLLAENFTIRSFLLNNGKEMEQFLNQKIGLNSTIIEVLLDSTFNFSRILGPSAASSQFNNVVCDSDALQQYLIMPVERVSSGTVTIADISAALCRLDEGRWSALAEALRRAVDSAKIAHMASKMAVVLGDDSMANALNESVNLLRTAQQLGMLSNLDVTSAELDAVADILPNLLTIFSAAKNSEIDLKLLTTVLDDLEYLAPNTPVVQRSKWRSWKTIIGFTQKLVNWIKFHFTSPTAKGLTIGSLFQKSKAGLEGQNVKREIGALYDQPLSGKEAGKIMRVRTEQDLKQIICARGNFTAIEPSKLSCDQNDTTSEWQMLLEHTDLASFAKEVEHQHARSQYGSLDLMIIMEEAQKIQNEFRNSTDDTLKSMIAFANSVRLEPLWKSVTETATTGGHMENVARAALRTVWLILDAFLRSNPTWEKIKEMLHKELIGLRWLIFVMQKIPETPMTFGGLFQSPVTVDEFIAYIAKYSPTLVAAHISAEATSELIQLEKTVSMEKNPKELRYVFCQSPGFVNLVRFGQSVDRQKIREIQDALCRLDMQKLIGDLKTAFDYDGFLNQFTAQFQNLNTTLLDVYLAQGELIGAARERIQKWMDTASRERSQWELVKQAWRESKGSYKNTAGEPVAILDFAIYRIRNSLDPKSASVIVEISRALSADISRYQGGNLSLLSSISSLPMFVSSVLETAADPQRLERLITVPDWRQTFCENFDSYFAKPVVTDIQWLDRFSRQRIGVCQSGWKNKLVEDVTRGWKSSQLLSLVTGPGLDAWNRPGFTGAIATEAEWQQVAHNSSQVLDFILSADQLVWDWTDGAGTIQHSFQHFTTTFMSSSIGYHANLLAGLLRLFEVILTNQKDTYIGDNTNEVLLMAESIITPVDQLLSQVQRVLSAPLAASVKAAVPSTRVLQDAIANAGTVTDEMLGLLKATVIDPEKLLQQVAKFPQHQASCKAVSLDQFVAFPNNATERQTSEIKRFLCSNFRTMLEDVKKFASEKMNITNFAMKISDIGSKLDRKFFGRSPTVDRFMAGQTVPTMLNDAGAVSAGILDSVHAYLESSAKHYPATQRIWNIFKTGVMYFSGFMKIGDLLVTAISKRTDIAAGAVTVLIEDIVEVISPELLKAVAYLERIPDVAEYLLFDLVNHPEKIAQLFRHSRFHYEDLCRDQLSFLNFLPDNSVVSSVTNRNRRASYPSDRKPLSAHEMFSLLCRGAEIDYRKAMQQQYDQNPELFAAVHMSTQLIRGQFVDDFPINLAAAYGNAAKVVDRLKSWTRINWMLFRDSRILDAHYWSGMYYYYGRNINMALGQGTGLQELITPLLDHTLSRYGYGAPLAIIKYWSDRFQQRLREDQHHTRGTLETLLRSKTELWKFASWIDSSNNLVRATEVLLYSLIGKPRNFGELLASIGQYRERLCMDAWSHYLTIPPGMRQEDVLAMLAQICDIDWDKAAVEAIDTLESTPNSGMDARTRLEQLKQQFAHQQVDTGATVGSLVALMRTLREMQQNQPSVLGSFRMPWLNQAAWNDMGQRVRAQLMNGSRTWSPDSLSTALLDDYLRHYPTLYTGLKHAATGLNLISWQLLFVGTIGDVSSHWANSLEIGKLTPIFANLWRLVDDILKSRDQLHPLIDRLARSSNPRNEFCNQMLLDQYIRSSLSEVVKQAICGVDWRKLTEELVQNGAVDGATDFTSSRLVLSFNMLIDRIRRIQSSWTSGASRIYGGTAQQWQETVQQIVSIDLIGKNTLPAVIAAGSLAAVVPFLPEPVIRGTDAVVVAAVTKLRPITSSASVTLESIFPSSPYLRQSLQRALPMLPQLVEAFLWSTSHITRSFASFESVEQAQSTLCFGPESSVWWSKITSPTLSEADRFSMSSAVCWILQNWQTIQAEIEKELALSDLSAMPSGSGKLISDVSELLSIWNNFGPAKPQLIIGGGDSWIQAETYSAIFSRWKETHGSMEQFSSEFSQFLERAQLDHVPVFGGVSRAVEKLLLSMANNRSNQTDTKTAFAYLIQKLSWSDVQVLPEFADAMVELVGSVAGRNVGEAGVGIRKYTGIMKSVLQYLNEYGRMMPYKNEKLDLSALMDDRPKLRRTLLEEFPLSKNVVELMTKDENQLIMVLSMAAIPDIELTGTFCNASRVQRIFMLNNAAQGVVVSSELCAIKNVSQLRDVLTRSNNLRSLFDQVDKIYHNDRSIDQQLSIDDLRNATEEFFHHLSRFIEANGVDWTKEAWVRYWEDTADRINPRLSPQLIRLADRTRSLEANRFAEALDDLLKTVAKVKPLWDKARPTVQALRARMWAAKLRNRTAVTTRLDNALHQNGTIESVLRAALLNDPVIVGLFKDVELDVGRYFGDGLNIHRGLLCKNRTFGGTILWKQPGVESKVSERLCRLDYSRLVYAVDEAVDIDKLLGLVSANASETNPTFGELVKQLISDNSAGLCEKCKLRINGTEFLADIADLSKSEDWPELKKRIVATLKAAEGIAGGTEAERQLSEYRRNVDSIASILMSSGRSRKMLEKESVVPTVRDLIKDPHAFTKFLERQLSIPYKFAQTLLAAHVKPSKAHTPRNWCERGRLAHVFIAVDADTQEEIERVVCMTYYPAVIEELDRQISIQPTVLQPPVGPMRTPAAEASDWDTFLDRIVYISRNLPQSSPDTTIFDAQGEFGQSIQAVKLMMENPTTTSVLDALGRLATRFLSSWTGGWTDKVITYTDMFRTLADKMMAEDGITVGSLMGDNFYLREHLANVTGFSVADLDIFLKARIRFPQFFQLLSSDGTTSFCNHSITDFVVPADGNQSQQLQNLQTAACVNSSSVFLQTLTEIVDVDKVIQKIQTSVPMVQLRNVSWQKLFSNLRQATLFLNSSWATQTDLQQLFDTAGISVATILKAQEGSLPTHGVQILADAMEKALKPFAAVGLDLVTVVSREDLVKELIERLEKALSDAIDQMDVDRLEYISSRTVDGERELRAQLCQHNVVSAFGQMATGLLDQLRRAPIVDWPKIVRSSDANGTTARLTMTKIVNTLASASGVDPAAMEATVWSITSKRKSFNSSWYQLMETLARMKSNETAWWPSIFMEALRNSHHWKSSTQQEITKRLSRLSNLSQSTFGINLPMFHDVRHPHGGQWGTSDSGFDWSMLLNMVSNVAETVMRSTNELRVGGYESRVRTIVEPLVGPVQTSCASSPLDRILHSDKILRYLQVTNDHIRALPGYKEIICSWTASNVNIRQLYDYFIYQSTRSRYANDQSYARPRCNEFVEQMVRLSIGAAAAADYLSVNGGKLLQCIRFTATENVFRSADKYLELTSAAGQLLSDPQMEAAKPLFQKFSRSLTKDQQRYTDFQNAAESLLNSGPGVLNGLLQFASRSVEFIAYLMKSADNDWRSLTFGKVLRAVESMKSGGTNSDWSKSYESAQRLLSEEQYDAAGNDRIFPQRTRISGIGMIEKSLRDILDQSYPVVDVVQDANYFRSFVAHDIKLPVPLVETFMVTKVYLGPILAFIASNATSVQCTDLLNTTFPDQHTFALLLKPLCDIPDADFYRLWVGFVDQLRPWPLLQRYIEQDLDSKMRKRGFTVEDAKATLRWVMDLPAVLPELRDLVAYQKRDVSSIDDMKDNEERETRNSLDFGRLLCGDGFRLGSLDPSLLRMDENRRLTANDEVELRQLPSPYCRNTYLSLMSTGYGTVVWKFLKPLIRGKIFVAPDTAMVRSLMTKANKTFADLESWFRASEGIKATTADLTQSDLSSDESLILAAMKHPLLRIGIADWTKANPEALESGLTSFRYLDATTLAALRELAAQVHNLSECVVLDRFVFYSTESNLELAARRTLESGDTLAAVVFDLDNSDTDEPTQLPKRIKYKIRMASDRVPPTDDHTVRYSAGIMENFFPASQYLYGFVALQDAIDHAIVELKGGGMVPSVAYYAQELPIPCYQKDEFRESLRYFLPLIAVVACVVNIGSTIRSAAAESEQGLTQIMKAMGLRSNIRWTAWFISSSAPCVAAAVTITFILKFGLILPSSGFGLLLVLVILFQISLVTLSYLVSVFFTKANSATVAGVIVYLILYVPYILICPIGTTVVLPYWVKVLGCLSAPTAFSCALAEAAVWEERGNGVQMENMDEVGYARGEISFGVAMVMILVDCVLYWTLGCVLARLMKRKGLGAVLVRRKKPLAFSFLSTAVDQLEKSEGIDVNADANLPIGLSIKNLTKLYASMMTGTPALCDLSVDLYDGQVTTLLGRNGAGKTTAINMLTGSLRPTSGAAFVYGKQSTGRDHKTGGLTGLCPQFNVLHDQMTVREHLYFYGALKSTLSREALRDDVQRLLVEMDLVSVADTAVGRLSGGTRRRVCVAMAFCGGNKCVILDEPSAGVDPVARRQLWDVIEKQKSGRTILLSTHYMDEAERLSDRVAILHRGRLLSCTPVRSLRQGHGTMCVLRLTKGARMTSAVGSVTRDGSQTLTTSALVALVKECFPYARMVADCGKMLDISWSSGLAGVDVRTCCSALERLFRRLDSVKSALNVEHYSFRHSNLEEIFLNVTSGTDDEHSLIAIDHNAIKSSAETTPINQCMQTGKVEKKPANRAKGMRLKVLQMGAMLKKRLLRTKRDMRLLFNSFVMPCLLVTLAMGLNLLKTNPNSEGSLAFAPEMYGPGSAMFISQETPEIGKFGLGVKAAFAETEVIGPTRGEDGDERLRSASAEPERLTTSVLGQISRPSCSCRNGMRVCSADNADFEAPHRQLKSGNYLYDFTDAVGEKTLSEYLVDQRSVQERHGGWSIGEWPSNSTSDSRESLYLKIWHSSNDPHALPAFVTGASNMVLRSALDLNSIVSDASGHAITTYSHPILSGRDSVLKEANILNKVADFGVAVVLVVAFSLIAAALATLAVEERASKQRHLQRLSGVGRRLYWTCTLLWDFAIYALAVVAACLIMIAFGHEAYASGWNLCATAILLLFYGSANLVTMYHLQRYFVDSTVAFVGLLSFCLFIIINTMVCVALLTVMAIDGEAGDTCRKVKMAFLIFPQYALGGGLVELTANHFRRQVGEELGVSDLNDNPLSLDVVGSHVIALIVQFLVLTTLGLFVDIDFGRVVHRLSYRRTRNDSERNCARIPEDVEWEQDRVLGASSNGEGSSYIMRLMNVRKTYPKASSRPSAISGITFGVHKGECFGLLGLNGAGKTTVLEMITGGLLPTNGEIEILGRRMKTKNDWSELDAASYLGYCPQQNACDTFLTVREALIIHATMLGCIGDGLNEMVSQCIEDLHLAAVAMQRVKQLSGGYQRLVCLALALLDRPQLLVLDEPTSGMDPRTRRFVWSRLLAELDSGRSIILSTHAIDDCEAFCNRCAVMVNGGLRCLGTLNQLRSRFEFGYEVTVWLIDSRHEASVRESAASWFVKAIEKHGGNDGGLQFFVAAETDGILTSVFAWLNCLMADGVEISDFIVEYSPLDKMFVNFIQRLSNGIESTLSCDRFCRDNGTEW